MRNWCRAAENRGGKMRLACYRSSWKRSTPTIVVAAPIATSRRRGSCCPAGTSPSAGTTSSSSSVDTSPSPSHRHRTRAQKACELTLALVDLLPQCLDLRALRAVVCRPISLLLLLSKRRQRCRRFGNSALECGTLLGACRVQSCHCLGRCGRCICRHRHVVAVRSLPFRFVGPISWRLRRRTPSGTRAAFLPCTARPTL